LLNRTERSVMSLPVVLHERERRAKFGMEGVGAVAHDGQAAALTWPVFGKRSDDYMASRSHGPKNSLDVGMAVFILGKKVEDRSIVPKVIGMERKLYFCNVRFKPGNLIGARSETSLCGAKRCCGKIKYGDI